MERLIDLSTLGIGERNPNAFNDPERAHGWNDLLKILEAAPTVDDVEVVRHGKWLEWFPGDCALIMTGEEMLYRCSSCDAKYSDAEEYKYCPCCGAKMDLEEV